MNEVAEKVFKYLKKSGKVSGGQVKDRLGISDLDYRKAKGELKAAGLVITGRGRGGTISLREGAEPPQERPKPTQAELMKYARERKYANKKQTEKKEKLEKIAFEAGEREHPDADRIEVQVWNIDQGHVYVYPFYSGKAQTHEIWINLEAD